MAQQPAGRAAAPMKVGAGKAAAVTRATAKPPAAKGQSPRAQAPVRSSGKGPHKGSSKNTTLILAIVAMMALALFERPVAVLMLFALVPTMVAWLVDDTPGQSLIRTVAPLNLASSLPFAIKLWHENNSLAQLFTFLSAGYTWVALYGAALFGWLLYYLAPAAITLFIQHRIERARATALERQAALKDEWGDEVES